jgi:hypothetical protein
MPFVCLQAIEVAATLYDDYCRVITPENLLTEESEEVRELLLFGMSYAVPLGCCLCCGWLLLLLWATRGAEAH